MQARKLNRPDLEDLDFSEILVALGLESRTSGSVARNSDH
jgi:hypothetical protein